MKIEPVYLVAPEPERRPPRPPSRRTFLLGAICGIGVGAGAAVVAFRSIGEAPPREAQPPAVVEDPRIQWALEARQGPLEDLVRANTDYLIAFAERPDLRAELTEGLERLIVAVLEDDALVAGQRRILATKLAQTIDGVAADSPLRRWLRPLRRVAR